MSNWVSNLLVEWRQRLASPPTHDQSSTHGWAEGGAPLRALDLLREHIKRAGVTLRLHEPGAAQACTASGSEEVAGGAQKCVLLDENDSMDGGPRFGKRHPPQPPAIPPLTSRPTHSSRDMFAMPRGRVLPSFRERGDDVGALRAEIAQLKETLADLLVENHALKSKLHDKAAQDAHRPGSSRAMA